MDTPQPTDPALPSTSGVRNPDRAGTGCAAAEFGPAGRVFAALLAAVWLLGGLFAFFLAFAQHRWFALVIAPFAIGYGVLWVRVARTGRRLDWPIRRR